MMVSAIVDIVEALEHVVTHQSGPRIEALASQVERAASLCVPFDTLHSAGQAVCLPSSGRPAMKNGTPGSVQQLYNVLAEEINAERRHHLGEAAVVISS
jgi:hypothetical protein